MTETGYFTVDAQERRARGILIPYGVKSKGTSASGTKPITFPRGNLRIPRDPRAVTLNDEHQRFQVLATADVLEDRDEGVYAEFTFHDTDEADRWLTEHTDGAYFSGEVADMTRAPGDIGAGRVAGAAVTTTPAFDGTFATFSLIGEETPAEEPDEETPDSAPAEEDTEPDEEPDETEEDAVAEATVQTPAQFSRKPSPAQAPALTATGFVRDMLATRTGIEPAALQPYLREVAEVGLFALDDIKYDDATTGLVKDFPGSWLGELFKAAPDVRTFIDAVGTQALRDLTASGWQLSVHADAIDEWAGNKTEIPSETPTVALKEFAAQRYAGGNDLAREYWDFNKLDVIESWVRAMVRLYKQKSDTYAIAQALAGATAGTLGTVPAGASKGLAAIYDLSAQVLAAGGQPNVIRVEPSLYREIGLTLDGNQFAYMGASLTIAGEGDLSGISFRPDNRLTARGVFVADRAAIGIWELPGSPIRVNAEVVSRGGRDEAFFGYIAAGVVDPAVVLKATVAA